MNNEGVLIVGRRLRLVPYLRKHVPRYHQWMSEAEMLECTASDPLTLREEYDNQREWLYSEDKLTFIVLAPLQLLGGDEKNGKNADMHGGGESCGATQLQYSERGNDGRNRPCETISDMGLCDISGEPVSEETISNGEAYIMVGDCNLFILPDAGEDIAADATVGIISTNIPIDGKNGVNGGNMESGGPSMTTEEGGRCFEVEVMIAERAFRRLGVGEEAVRLLMSYALINLGATRFVAKIRADNTPSIRLFTKKLGFTLLKEVPVFGELHYVKHFNEFMVNEWRDLAGYAAEVYNAAAEQKFCGSCPLLQNSEG